MSMDWIGLNLLFEGEIRHQSVANGLQDFQSVTSPFTFESVKNPRIGSDQFYEPADFFCTPNGQITSFTSMMRKEDLESEDYTSGLNPYVQVSPF